MSQDPNKDIRNYIQQCIEKKRPGWLRAYSGPSVNQDYLKILCTETDANIDKKCQDANISNPPKDRPRRIETCYGYKHSRLMPSVSQDLSCRSIEGALKDKRFLGRGTFANVYLRCDDTGRNCKAIRLIKKRPNKQCHSINISNMSEYYEKGSSHGIVPKFYGGSNCNNSNTICGFTKQEYIQGHTLSNILLYLAKLKRHPYGIASTIFSTLYKSLENFWKYYNNGHGDLGFSNIMLRTNVDITKVSDVLKENPQWVFVDLNIVNKKRTILDDMYTMFYYSILYFKYIKNGGFYKSLYDLVYSKIKKLENEDPSRKNTTSGFIRYMYNKYRFYFGEDTSNDDDSDDDDLDDFNENDKKFINDSSLASVKSHSGNSTVKSALFTPETSETSAEGMSPVNLPSALRKIIIVEDVTSDEDEINTHGIDMEDLKDVLTSDSIRNFTVAIEWVLKHYYEYFKSSFVTG